MEGKDWAALIEKVPPLHRDGLGIYTSSGVSISIQNVMRMEDNYMVVRGRLMGSQDQGMTFFLPYDQIDCLVCLRILKEPEIQAWFGEGPLAEAARKAAEAAAASPDGDAAAAETPAETADGPAPVAQPLATTTSGTPLPGKAAILDRLRKKAGGSSQGTVPKPSIGGLPRPGAPAPGTPPRPGGGPGGTPPRPGGGPGGTPPAPPPK